MRNAIKLEPTFVFKKAHPISFKWGPNKVHYTCKNFFGERNCVNDSCYTTLRRHAIHVNGRLNHGYYVV